MTNYRDKKALRIANRTSATSATTPKNDNLEIEHDHFAFKKFVDKLLNKSNNSLKALEFVDKLLINATTIENALAKKQAHFSNVTDKANYCLSFKNASQFKNHIVNRQKQNFVFEIHNNCYKLVAIKKTK